MNTVFQRARSPEHKALRRQAILDAATTVLERDGWHATSLNAIAREAGVVKSGLYRYFESREEILLRLMLCDVENMIEEFERQSTSHMSLIEIADLIATGFSSRPRLCLLVSRLASTLETNVADETLRDVKRQVMTVAGRGADAMHRAVPHLSAATCLDYMHMLFVLVSGLWPMTNPPSHVAEVMNEAEFRDFNREFAPTVQIAARALVLGMERASISNTSDR